MAPFDPIPPPRRVPLFRSRFNLVLVPCLFVGISTLAIFANAPLSPIPLDEPVGFNESIRPILAQHCIACHGPDEEHREAGLRLDIRDDALDAIEPGSPEDSELVTRIESSEDDRMPPAKHGDSLTKDQIDLIKKWIKQGAKYETHWSFVNPSKPAVPNPSFEGWGRNEIDQFVAAKLKQKKLQPSKDGDPHRLIRRLALDLTGLPPTPEMVKTFAASPTDETYESIVDQLLASPGYGEHWAAMWMDIARYADTLGYAEDRNRDIWPWRDWVIRAFNSNMPYDQFTTEQLAGDLLPNPTTNQRLATAFHRNTLSNTEGGTSDEEFRMIAVKDRISTTMNVWMGLTLRCAECHTHKYDPISQTEYYQFLDYFNQTVDSDKNDDRPRMEVYPKERWAKFEKIDRQLSAISEKIKTEPEVWKILAPSKTESRDGTKFTVNDDKSILPTGPNPRFDEYRFSLPLPAGTFTGLRLEVFPDKTTGGNTGRSDGGAWVVSQIRAALEESNDSEKTTVKPSGGDKEVKKDVVLSERPLKFSKGFADHSQPNHQVKIAIAEKPAKTGWAVNHRLDKYRVKRTAVLEFEKPLVLKETATLKFYLLHASPWPGHNVGRVRVSATETKGPADLFKKRKLDPLRWKREQLHKDRNSPVRVPVLEDRNDKDRRETFINIRGSYLAKGEKVSAAVPASFHAMPKKAPKNRLGVAQWINSKQNPLTARVTVNRFWARLFGMGIVETEEDFGTQGTAPSHQHLLDWLAVDFRDHGWDVKRLLKQIVMSSTYRQDNRATKEHLQLDPRNQFLARGPRFRLSAEVVRDQALAVSGLLSDRQFGPPVYPPNPVKRIVNAFTGGFTWVVSKGEHRNRRALYTFLKRSSPHPLFDTFDMASRTVCNMRRIRTNTPLQSFMTLNDETFIDAARALAQRMHAHSDDPRERIKFGLERALLHPAKKLHLETLTGLYSDTLTDYQKDQAAAAKFSGLKPETADAKKQSEIAALTVVVNVILNLDEFLTR